MTPADCGPDAGTFPPHEANSPCVCSDAWPSEGKQAAQGSWANSGSAAAKARGAGCGSQRPLVCPLARPLVPEAFPGKRRTLIRDRRPEEVETQREGDERVRGAEGGPRLYCVVLGSLASVRDTCEALG